MAVAGAGKLHRVLTRLVVVALAMAGAVAVARGDFAADRAECADKLMGLATCLTYVQATATAPSPTPDCCAGLKTVVTASKKCLCVLVKDRDDPALGFQINVTRAMDLPDNCKFTATFSDCPSTYLLPSTVIVSALASATSTLLLASRNTVRAVPAAEATVRPNLAAPWYSTCYG
jgi:hypothetical protein